MWRYGVFVGGFVNACNEQVVIGQELRVKTVFFMSTDGVGYLFFGNRYDV